MITSNTDDVDVAPFGTYQWPPTVGGVHHRRHDTYLYSVYSLLATGPNLLPTVDVSPYYTIHMDTPRRLHYHTDRQHCDHYEAHLQRCITKGRASAKYGRGCLDVQGHATGTVFANCR